MLKSIKNILRKLLFSAGIDLTKNQQYDRQTLAIMKKLLRKDSNCIDVGCHKGEVLDEMIKMAPEGKHYGFEPIPEYYDHLVKKYSSNKNIYILKNALSDSNGTASFNWVKNAPAYSGLQERSYSVKSPVIEKIEVELTRLDDCKIDLTQVALMKIDVEGAEMKVLKGATLFIQQHQPVIVFEFGMGAADYYGTEPGDVFDFFNNMQYRLNTLKGFLAVADGLSKEVFSEMYHKNTEYYFAAYPA
jgi:FkbM family methyltransferase